MSTPRVTISKARLERLARVAREKASTHGWNSARGHYAGGVADTLEYLADRSKLNADLRRVLGIEE